MNYTIAGSAANGTDYTTIPTLVVFNAGSDRATVTIDPIADVNIESDETVSLTISRADGYIIGTPGAVTGTILNDEKKPSISLNLSPAIVKESGRESLQYTFTRDSSVLEELTVNFTLGGTATNITDYTLTGARLNRNIGTLTFAYGSSTATVIVAPTPDTNGDLDETVTVAINTSSQYDILTTGQVIGTIADGDDLINGTAAADTLNGGGGRDTLNGLEGNDSLIGGAGADSLVGGTGNDTYILDNVGDVVVENTREGTDTVLTSVSFTGVNIEVITLIGSSPIFATGDDNNNQLNGNNAANILTGGIGNDSLNGNNGNDSLIGGIGDDLLIGGKDVDTLVGGMGNDNYVVDNIGDVVVENLNEGTDTVQTSVNFTGSNIEIINLTGSANINATADNNNNLINGNDGANLLNGGGGNDNLIGNLGKDTLIGGLGNDTLNGGVNIDSMVGGAGNDIYIVDNLADVVLENPDGGTDTVQTSVNFASNNIEIITLIGNASINASGDDNNNQINGNNAANLLSGGGGNDNLIGNSGNDSLIGGLGDDTLDGGGGSDSLDGGVGNDTYILDNLADIVVENSNGGTDTVQTTVNFVGQNIEVITLIGIAPINGTGDNNNNVINGNDGFNVLTGNEGNDTLRGNRGNDRLIGGLGNDSLDGGIGTDTLTGGSGRDTFVFSSTSAGIDLITDFSLADNDIISLSSVGFNLPAGVLNPSAFRGGARIISADSPLQRLIYNSTTGALFFDADGNGTSSSAIQFASLSNLPVLTATNFSIF